MKKSKFIILLLTLCAVLCSCNSNNAESDIQEITDISETEIETTEIEATELETTESETTESETTESENLSSQEKYDIMEK